MFAKAGLGLIGLSAISVGGVALAKPHLLGMDYMPSYETLSKKTNALTGKWVKDYRIYFVDSEGNDAWFDWVFRNRYNNEDSKNKTVFAGIKQGRGNTTDNSLAKACKDAYDKTSSEVVSPDSSATEGKIFEDNIWKYCSVGGGKLKTVDEETDKSGYSGKVGDSNKEDLLSAEYEDNDWAWHIKQKEFLNGTGPSSNSVFKKFYTDNQKHKGERNGTKLKEGCKKWYKDAVNSTDGDSKLTAEDLKKYCSLKVDESIS